MGQIYEFPPDHELDARWYPRGSVVFLTSPHNRKQWVEVRVLSRTTFEVRRELPYLGVAIDTDTGQLLLVTTLA